MTPTPTRKALLPVLEAIAEALMPSQPDKAAAARMDGKQDVARLYAASGNQQKNHMSQANQACCLTHFIGEVLANTEDFPLQILVRMETNLTPESQTELFLYDKR